MTAPPPPAPCTLDEAAGRDAFLVEGTAGRLWFEQGSPVLYVTFDNLATVEQPAPRLPWMHSRLRALGYSILGVQTFAKDWYRQTTAPDLIGGLLARGFFSRFKTVIFTGASMGGFAALNLAALVPGARVLAFSPQSSMSRRICPFERRFAAATRGTNWTDPPFLDAAEAIPALAHAVILHDPFVPEDRRHAARLAGPNVQFLRTGHFGHQAIRLVIKCDALPELLAEYAETGQVGAAFWARMRRRKSLRLWNRTFLAALAQSRHPRLALRAATALHQRHGYDFARDTAQGLLREHPELAAPLPRKEP